jgi:16S rRNA (cytosine1402-N4)-methyltransferase
VVTFHSLEDRIVKTFLAERAAPSACRAICLMSRRRRRPSASDQAPVCAGRGRVAANPRARSAKLRAGERSARRRAALDCELLPRCRAR